MELAFSRPSFLRRAIAGFALTLLLAAPALARNEWAQSNSDLAADPAVRYGRLDNGMRYAILRNATPAGQAALRLRIGSGSLQESEGQQGLAHFLEHMAFKGSTHVPQGEMIKILERKGLAFGADTNAETGYGQTVYKLDLPQVDDDTLDTGLMLLRETASELTLDAGAFDAERGVILSEERLRDTPDYRTRVALLDLLLNGQKVTQRPPIGKVEVIRNAPVSAVADFYRANYRPDNAALVVVGDFDPAAMEARIKARFADWKPAGPAQPAPDLGSVRLRGLTAKVVEEPGAAIKVQIGFVRPFDDAPDSVAARRRDVIESFGPLVLNHRLARLARDTNPPFLRASAALQDAVKSAEITVLTAETSADHWQSGLEAIVAEQRRLVRFGVTQEELDREIVERRAGFQSGTSGAATRRTVDLAAALVGAVDGDKVFNTPAADQALFESIVKDLKADTLNKTLGSVFGGAGPLVQLVTPKAPDGGEAVLRVAFEKADAIPVAAPLAKVSVPWPYASFGPPGAVVERQEVLDLGVVTVRFANNVRLIVKPTKFSQDQVLVSTHVGNGILALPVDAPSAAWACYGFISGGLKAIDQLDTEKAFAGILASSSFSIGERAFQLNGVTRPSDLLMQLQLLAARVSQPGFRPEAFPQTRAAFLAYLPQLEATPAGVLNRDLSAILHSDDPRWRFPTQAEVEATAPDALQKLLTPDLAGGPLDVTIVGNIGADDAIRMVAQTFGALPPRTLAPPPPAALGVRFPSIPAEPIIRTHKGRADQAIALMAWPTTDFLADTARARALVLAGDILQNRVRDQLRVGEGATYSPVGTVDQSLTFPGYGYAYSYVETPPAKVESFFAHVEKITDDMKVNGVTADELLRAKTPEVEAMKKELLTNAYWLRSLAGALADPRAFDLIRSRVADYERVTPTDIQMVVSTFLADHKPLRVLVLPEGAPKS